MAYVFFHEGVKAGYATDLGHPIALMDQHLAGCRLLVLEFNHDPAMLVNGPYPWPVKQWIKGQGGHLSNEQAAKLLEDILRHDTRLEALVLAHLSETNNTPELALARGPRGARALSPARSAIALHVAGPDDPPVTVHRRRRGATARPLCPARCRRAEPSPHGNPGTVRRPRRELTRRNET